MAPSVLAVFAHPDDESLASGGLLAWCAHEGARVAVLCLTRGEHGPGGEPEQLRRTRTRELQDAAGTLGVTDVVILDHEDGMLPWIDPEVLDADVLAAIRRVVPDVVVTFDEDGLYGHPDHVAVHERTTAVVADLGPDAPALRYVSMPRGAMRALVEGAASAVVLGVTDPDAFGAMAPEPSLVLDVSRFAGQKLRALRCHRTQVAGGVFDRLDEGDAPRFLGMENYRHADVGARGVTFIEGLGAHTPGQRAG
jgi:LmbE family N-acetylglucosaminyl deacetylase